MKYNSSSVKERQEAFTYLTKLCEKGAVVEVKRVFPTRSLSQNAYLHLIISVFGNHFGYRLEEAKQVYKEVNKDIYLYKHPKGRSFYRSSTDLTVEEMAKSIDRFMEKSAEAGCPLPLATNPEEIMSLQNELEKSNYY